MSVTDIILDKLDSRGIVACIKCGSYGKKAHIDKIIKELKTEAKHYALFNRAKDAGEDVKEVDYALRQLIFNIHTQRNKRQKRQKRVDKKVKIQSSAQRAPNTYSAPFLSEPAANATPAPNQGPTTTDQHSSEARQEPPASFPPNKRMVLVYINDESVPEMFTLNKAISIESEAASGSSTPQLSVLKANIEERLAPRTIDWDRLTIEMDGMQMQCNHQEVFAFVCAATEQQRGIMLRGLRALNTLYTTRPSTP